MLSGSFVPPVGSAFTIVTGTSVSGTFNSLPNLSTLVFNGKTLQIQYFADRVILSENSPPSATSVSVNDGAAQRSRVDSLAISFSRVVTLASGAFTLTGEDLNGNTISVGSINTNTVIVDGKTVATLTFSGTGTEFGSLVDGVWNLTVVASKVTVGGQEMTSNYVTPSSGVSRIHRLFGDINGDGTVEGGDFSVFSSTFNLSSMDAGFIAAFDFNADDTVEGGDFSVFSARFNTSL
jgi:hypothetical protein